VGGPNSDEGTSTDTLVLYVLYNAGRLRKKDNLMMGEGEGDQSYDGEKAWYSIIHQILSVPRCHSETAVGHS